MIFSFKLFRTITHSLYYMSLNLSFEALEDTSQILYLLNLVYRLQYDFVDCHNILIIITQNRWR